MPKLCEICRENKATVPDRDKPGRLINRICKRCHGLKLSGDMSKILEYYKNSRNNNG